MGSLAITDETLVLDSRTRDEAQEVLTQVNDDEVLGVTINVAGHEIKVGAEAAELIMHVLSQTAQGNRMSITSLPEQFTTTSAAKILGISRPTLMKLVQEGKIQAVKVGTHNRIRLEELNRFRARRRLEKRELIREISDISFEIGEQD